MRVAIAQLLCFVVFLRTDMVKSAAILLASASVYTHTDVTNCSIIDHVCWDGFNCFQTDDTCLSGKAKYNYGGCGDCGHWDNNVNGDMFCMSFVHLVGDPYYPQLPNGTTFSPAPAFGNNSYFIYRLSRYVHNYTFNYTTRTCNLWRAPSLTITVNCPTGYYATVSTATCSDNNVNHITSGANYGTMVMDSAWRDDDCCYNCYSWVNHGNHDCVMCAQWDRMPACQAGCVLPTLGNGSVAVTYAAAGALTPNVYPANATINYTCNSGYYLSTNNLPTISATCAISGNNIGSWSAVPKCLSGCPQLTIATGTGAVSYVPNLPAYSPTGYVPQTIMAVFNCTSGYYLDPANYTYNCTGPNGIWDLGNSAPVCRMGCSSITTFSNGQIVYTPATNLITGVYRWTTVATFNCSTGYYLSTLTSTATTDCNVTGSWTAIPQCLPGCPAISTFSNGQTIPYSPNTVVNSLYTQGTTTIFNCSAGYYLSTLTTVNSSVCLGSGQWSFVPNCTIGCPSIPSLANGNIIYSPLTTTDNGVYRQNSFATFTCLNNYYLSTLTTSNSTDCSGNGNWSNIPTCLAACSTLTLVSGTISYSPGIPAYMSSGYVPQSTLAIFNCSTGFYLDPANYIYNCTGPSWNLGSSAPVCRAGCQNISFANGLVVYTPGTNLVTGVYRWTTTATFTCSTGYYLSTLTSTTTTDCNVTGSWTAIPQCLRGCPDISTFANGQTIPYSPNTVVNSLYTQGTTTIFNCSAGYYLTTLTTVNSSICLGNGSWSFVPNCTIGCPPISSLANGNAIVYSPLTTTDNGVYRQNSFATFTCLNNYYLSTLTTSNSTDCNGNGNWSNIPTCLAACANLTLSSGSISYSPSIPTYTSTGYVPQATLAIFNCSAGFYLDPPNYVYNCTGPSWNLGSSAPVCRAGCQNISFANGLVVYTPGTNWVNGVYRWTTVATFTCSTGYYLSTLTNSTTTDCNVTGSWTAIPQCGVGCPAITTFTHGQTIPYSPITLVNGLYTMGTTTIFNCSAGYYLTTLTTVNSSVCLANGSWSFVPNCTIGCPPIPSLANGNAIIYSPLNITDNGVYRQNSFATFTCLNGYYLSTLTASNSTDCNGTGVWSNIPTCLAACVNLTLASGTISYSPSIPTYIPTGFVPQATIAIFNCSTGFYLDPANYIYNCIGPSWDLGTSVPVCTAGCQNISFANGLVVYNPGSNWVAGTYRSTTIATFTCNNGFYLSTLAASTPTDCNNGIWTAIPQCLSGCQPITTFTNGQTIPYIPSLLVNSLYPQNTTAIFNCSDGYYLSTLTTVNSSICTGNGQWSFVPSCIIGCLDIGTFPDGIYSYTDAAGTTASLDNVVYRQNTTATFTCNFQYFLSTMTPSTTTVCNSNGGWTSVPTCTQGCLANDTQLQIANGARSSFVTSLASPITGYLYQTGDSVNFTCTGSNYLSSVSPAICTAGQWVGIPTCVVGCYVFPSNDSSLKTYANVTYSGPVSTSNPSIYGEGISAYFSCYYGTYLAGSPNATCLNGDWTNQPLCLPGCFAAPTIPNMDTMTYSVETVPAPLLHLNATVVRYTCKTFYQLVGTDMTTCLYGNWTYPLPSCIPIPLLLTVTKAAMTLSCTFLVIALGVIILVTIIIRDFSIETCLHLSEEFALFFAHLLILIFLNSVNLTDLCPAASAGIQYFITTAFLCMMIEAIHSFALLQNVISFGGVFDYPRLKNFIVGWFGGMIPTGITIAMRYDKYPSTYSCYVNLGDEISLYIMGPILALFLLTLILTEAAAMGDWKLLPLVSRQQVLAAHVNQKSMAILVFLSLGSWFFGLLASYLNNPLLFSIGAGVNTAFGVLVIIFHFVGNPKLNNWFHRKVLKRFCKKKELEPVAEIQDP